jgi:hypothetical protein
MGQIRNTRKIYFLNYNKLRLLLILRMYMYQYHGTMVPYQVQVYLLLCVFNVKFLEHDIRNNKNDKSRQQTTT